MAHAPRTPDFQLAEEGIRLLSCDLDGTVIFDGFPREDDLASIDEWRKAGNLVVCNSGRSVRAARYVLERGGLGFDYYVLYSGAAVFNSEWEPLMHIPLPKNIGYELAEWLLPHPQTTLFATTLNGRDAMLSSAEHQPNYGGTIDVNAHVIDYSEIKDVELMGMPIHVDGTDEEINALHKEILDRYGDVIDAHRNVSFIDVAPKNCSKASGLAWLINYLEESTDTPHIAATHTLGDSWNDLPMHEFADFSCSFAHSPADVQEATTHVTESTADYIKAVLGDL
ncbi:MAG: HAD family hydrolase [Corynebacterium sp.]|nr:HAD family hydrolase [Corynebacterium sp.]